MNTSALIMVILAYSSVTIITVYFFVKVLNTPSKAGDEDDKIPPVKSFDAT